MHLTSPTSTRGIILTVVGSTITALGVLGTGFLYLVRQLSAVRADGEVLAESVDRLTDVGTRGVGALERLNGLTADPDPSGPFSISQLR
jgi:hypothetical protein